MVAQGLATRLLRGDQAGAISYLANQGGLSRTEATQRIQGFSRDLQNTLRSVGDTTAQAISVTGWTLFVALMLGTISGVLGGGAGAEANLLQPSSLSDRKALGRTKAA